MRGRPKELDNPMGLTIWIDSELWNKLFKLKEEGKIKSISRFLRDLIREKLKELS